MKRIIALLALLAIVAGTASAAIINVTKANYIVMSVNRAKREFKCDLVQNGPEEKRVTVRLNKDAKCWRVHKGRKDIPVSQEQFLNLMHKGTRVAVTGGRDWDGQINASDVWAQD